MSEPAEELTSRIKCNSCTVESFNCASTKLHCRACYEFLRAERDQYKRQAERDAAHLLSIQTVLGVSDFSSRSLVGYVQDAVQERDEATKECERLVKANQHWHVRVTQLKDALAASEQARVRQQADIGRLTKGL